MRYLIIVALFIGVAAVIQTSEPESQPESQPAWIPYTPPAPDLPIGAKGSGFVWLDPDTPLAINAMAADRVNLYAMFPTEAKFYAINATYTWYWGDGTTSTGSALSHVYQRAGAYTVACFVEMSFRGGAVVRWDLAADIIVPEPSEPYHLKVTMPSTISGTAGGPTTTQPVSVTNTGGRPASVKLIAKKTGGTVDDLSWISFEPPETIIKPDGVEVPFVMTLKWGDAPDGTLQMTVDTEHQAITTGWHLKYLGGAVTSAPAPASQPATEAAP